MRRVGWLAAVLLLSACTAQAQITPIASATTTATAAPSPSAESTAVPADQGGAGPGGMTLRQEVGAVMMVGFAAPLPPALLDDWRQRQFGGLLLLPSNQMASDPAAIRSTIGSVRALMTHPLMAATDVEEGAATFAGLKALGFDIDLAPKADVGSTGTDATAVAQAVRATIAGLHAAGIYAVAKHFQNRDLAAFRTAIAAHVDMIMVGDLEGPAAGSDPSNGWPALLHALRADLRFQGPVISDDLQALVGQAGYSATAAAVRFLESGGDMVMVSHDVAQADLVYDAIYAAVSSGSYPRAQLDASVQRLLSLRLRYMP